MNKRLLIVAYFFPPVGGAGAQRPTKFAKYLVQMGWKVTVLTKEQENTENRWEPLDQSLAQDIDRINEQVRVVRIPAENSPSSFFEIDPLQGWSYAAGKEAVSLLKQDEYDAVLFTMSPFSLIMAAERVRNEVDLPILLDFRDPWVLDGWSPQKTFLHWKIQESRMRDALGVADGVIVNTPEVRSLFLKNFSNLRSKKLCVIENGYDAEDFKQSIDLNHSDLSCKKFTLVFSGSLCTQPKVNFLNPKQGIKHLLRFSPEKIDPSGRTLTYLLRAIELLREQEHPLGKEIRIECLGMATQMDHDSVADSYAGDAVTFCGYLPHTEAISKIRNADALFLPLHGSKNSQRSRIVPGKTYEYLATGRPILACLPDGDAREIVEKCNVGVVSDPLNPRDIAQALIQIYKIFSENSQLNAPEDWVSVYERRELTKKLAGFIERICA